MQTIYYNTGRLILSLIGGAIFTLIGLMLISLGHGRLAGILVALICPILCIGCVKILLSDQVALRFDNQRLSVATMWRKCELSWSEVTGIAVSTTSYSMFGFIKTGSDSSLEIKTAGSIFGAKTFSLSPGLLKLSATGFAGLAAQLQQARSGVAAFAPSAPTALASSSTVSRDPLEGARLSDDFDADAVFARYMARRDEAVISNPPQSPVRPVFGRKAA
jgi:hypothetical protein